MHLPTGRKLFRAVSTDAGKEVIRRLLDQDLDWDFTDPDGETFNEIQKNLRDVYRYIYFNNLIRHGGYTYDEREKKGLGPRDYAPGFTKPNS